LRLLVTEWDLLDFFKQHKTKWLTTKEIILLYRLEITRTEVVKFDRKLNQLFKANRLQRRKCNRSIAWRHELEFKYKPQKRK